MKARTFLEDCFFDELKRLNFEYATMNNEHGFPVQSIEKEWINNNNNYLWHVRSLRIMIHSGLVTIFDYDMEYLYIDDNDIERHDIKPLICYQPSLKYLWLKQCYKDTFGDFLKQLIVSYRGKKLHKVSLEPV